MAPQKIDATVQVDKKPEVQVEQQTLGAMPERVTVRPFSVIIYSNPASESPVSASPVSYSPAQ